jgi:hypothetical protein
MLVTQSFSRLIFQLLNNVTLSTSFSSPQYPSQRTHTFSVPKETLAWYSPEIQDSFSLTTTLVFSERWNLFLSFVTPRMCCHEYYVWLYMAITEGHHWQIPPLPLNPSPTHTRYSVGGFSLLWKCWNASYCYLFGIKPTNSFPSPECSQLCFLFKSWTATCGDQKIYTLLLIKTVQ